MIEVVLSINRFEDQPISFMDVQLISSITNISTKRCRLRKIEYTSLPAGLT